jgi:hypothetical protein
MRRSMYRFSPLLLILSTVAHGYELTSDCEDNITDGDRTRMNRAVAWLDQHREDVYDHVQRNRALPTLPAERCLSDSDAHHTLNHCYDAVSWSEYEDWSDEIDELLNGTEKIRCRYNDVNPGDCDDSSEGFLFGYNPKMASTINVCMSNINEYVDDRRGTRQQILVGVLAHELMHGTSSDPGHNPDGDTRPQDPWGITETMGAAAENLMATGELDPSLQVDVVANGNHHDLVLQARIKQDNNDAVNFTNPRSQDTCNSSTTAELTVDGTSSQTWSTSALGSQGFQNYGPHTVTVPAYQAGVPVHDVTVVADIYDVNQEIDEGDNTVTYEHSTYVDLSIDVELDVAPTYRFHPTDPFFELTYRVWVTNLDSDISSPEVDLSFNYDEMATGLYTSAPDELVPPLGAGEGIDFVYTVHVPSNASGTAPVGTTQLDWRVDDGVQSVYDRDWGNNEANISVNQAYWKPNYQVIGLGHPLFGTAFPGSGGTSPTLASYTVRIKNVGPVDAAASSFLEVVGTGTVQPGRQIIPAIPSATVSSSAQVTLQSGLCSDHSYTLTADADGDVFESVESDNSGFVVLGKDCPSGIGFAELGTELFAPISDELLYGGYNVSEMLTEAEQYRWNGTADWIAWVFESLGNGPFLPPEWVSQYNHTLVMQGDFHLWMSAPVGGSLTGLIFETPDVRVLEVNGAVLANTHQSQYPPATDWIGQ